MVEAVVQKLIAHLKGLAQQAFDFARGAHVEPVFNEAAEGSGDSSGGASYHGFQDNLLINAPEANTADNASNAILKGMRMNASQFTQMHLSKG